jgi:hypothetical protein
MKRITILTLSLAMVVGAALPALAQDLANPQGAARFAPPERMKAGDAWLGAKRLYPSPAVHDVDGDGVFDVVIGDLRGVVTFARGQRIDDGGVVLAAEEPMKDDQGKQLKFHNW